MARIKENPAAALAAKREPREVVTTFEGLVAALAREIGKLRAVDTYLNDDGKRRLRACETIGFLADFCESAAGLTETALYDELGDDADAVRDILMAIERIEKLEEKRP